jgi:hypothetical protein
VVSIILILLGSFLLSFHEKSSLAAAIAYHFEKQAQDVPEGRAVRPTPSRDGIQGFLQACEDQTSSFNWQNLLWAVGATLGKSGKDVYVTSMPHYLRKHPKTFHPKNEYESND